MALNDYRYALEFQETMKRLVREEVERQRPRYQMATVVSIDRTNRRCAVIFPGDTTNATVSMGAIQPKTPGQVVRVEGLSGDRYIADVMGDPYDFYPYIPPPKDPDPTWYPNLAPDPEAELSYTIPTDIANMATNKTQYSIVGTAVGSGGTVSASFSNTQNHSGSGTKSLVLNTSTTGSPTNSIQAKTPHFTVKPGSTYCASVWVLKNVTTASNVYIRIMGGATDALTEYPGTNIGNGLPTLPTFEARNLTTQNVWQQVVLTFTVPAGITRAAFRLYNWLPSAGQGIYFDDFRVIEVDGHPMSDTGWCRLPITNTTGFSNYGGNVDPQLRRIGNMVYYAGALNNLVANAALESSTVLATNTFQNNIPPLFWPAAHLVNPVFVCQGSSDNRWALRVYGDGTAVAHRYGPAASGVGTWLPFNVAWQAD